jgi:hypothetical protein
LEVYKYPKLRWPLIYRGKDIVTVKGSDDEMATVTAQGITKLKDSSKVVLVLISIILLNRKIIIFE